MVSAEIKQLIHAPRRSLADLIPAEETIQLPNEEDLQAFSGDHRKSRIISAGFVAAGAVAGLGTATEIYAAQPDPVPAIVREGALQTSVQTSEGITDFEDDGITGVIFVSPRISSTKNTDSVPNIPARASSKDANAIKEQRVSPKVADAESDNKPALVIREDLTTQAATTAKTEPVTDDNETQPLPTTKAQATPTALPQSSPTVKVQTTPTTSTPKSTGPEPQPKAPSTVTVTPVPTQTEVVPPTKEPTKKPEYKMPYQLPTPEPYPNKSVAAVKQLLRDRYGFSFDSRYDERFMKSVWRVISIVEQLNPEINDKLRGLDVVYTSGGSHSHSALMKDEQRPSNNPDWIAGHEIYGHIAAHNLPERLTYYRAFIAGIPGRNPLLSPYAYTLCNYRDDNGRLTIPSSSVTYVKEDEQYAEMITAGLNPKIQMVTGCGVIPNIMTGYPSGKQYRNDFYLEIFKKIFHLK